MEAKLEKAMSSFHLKRNFTEWLVLGGFMGLAILATFPLILYLTTGIPGTSKDTDVVTFVWNLWWVKYALLERHTNPFFTDAVFAPFMVDLRLHTLAPLHGVLSIPLQLMLGTIGASNVLLMGTIALNGYAVYRLSRVFIPTISIAFAIGAVVALSTPVMFHFATGRPSIASLWPIAFGMWSLYQLVKTLRWKYVVGLGFCLLSALLLDFQIVLYTFLWMAVFGLYLLVTERAAWKKPVLWLQIGVSLLFFFIPFFTVFYGPLIHAEELGYVVPSAKATLSYSLRWFDFFDPVVLRHIFGLPLAGLFVIACGLSWRNRKNWVWMLASLFFFILTLGIQLTPTEIPLPYAFLRQLPGLGQFRTPYRFNVPAMIAVGMTLGMAWQTFAPRLGKWGNGLLAGSLIIVHGISLQAVFPFQVQFFPEHAIYAQIAAQPGDFMVLEVPVGVRSGTERFGSDESLQIYQIIHEKRGLNGMVARMPAQVFRYYKQSPSLNLLAGNPVEASETDVAQNFAELVKTLNIRYVIVHPLLLDSATRLRIKEFLNHAPLLTLREKDPALWVYEITDS